MSDRKPLEGIEELLFVLGAGLGLFLARQNYSWWLIAIIIVFVGIGLGRLVQFLRNKNIKSY